MNYQEMVKAAHKAGKTTEKQMWQSIAASARRGDTVYRGRHCGGNVGGGKGFTLQIKTR